MIRAHKPLRKLVYHRCRKKSSSDWNINDFLYKCRTLLKLTSVTVHIITKYINRHIDIYRYIKKYKRKMQV